MSLSAIAGDRFLVLSKPPVVDTRTKSSLLQLGLKADAIVSDGPFLQRQLPHVKKKACDCMKIVLSLLKDANRLDLLYEGAHTDNPSLSLGKKIIQFTRKDNIVKKVEMAGWCRPPRS